LNSPVSLDDPKSAIDDLSLSISKNNNFTEAYMNKGKVNEKLGKLKEAAIDYENVLRTIPQFSNSQQWWAYPGKNRLIKKKACRPKAPRLSCT